MDLADLVYRQLTMIRVLPHVVYTPNNNQGG